MINFRLGRRTVDQPPTAKNEFRSFFFGGKVKKDPRNVSTADDYSKEIFTCFALTRVTSCFVSNETVKTFQRAIVEIWAVGRHNDD